MTKETTTLSPGKLADRLLQALESAHYGPGAAALVTVLSRWIAERSARPIEDGAVWVAALELLILEIKRENEKRGGVRDVAA